MITELLRKSKVNHYKEYFNENTNNHKKMWEGINQIIYNRKQGHSPKRVVNVKDNDDNLTNSKQTAEVFNNFFTTIASNIKSKIRSSKKLFNDYLPAPNPCNANDIIKLIKSLKPGKSIGPNSISIQLLKELKDVLSYPLTHLFNLSLSQGIFPDAFKVAKVIPIFKSGERTNQSNYRPISLLSNLGKLLEKVVHIQLSDFFEHEKLLYELQFGFRLKTSTNHALISIVDKIQSNIEKGLISCGKFVDLQKAFDTVDHSILISKLSNYGVRGKALIWFHSYLTDRKQFVYVNNIYSKTEFITDGVPQGSILGPLLFIIFINDLHLAIPYSKVHHFADDTNLLLSNKSLKKLTLNINHDLTCLCEWLRSNKLALNVSKTEVIIFKRPNTKLNYKYKFRIDGHKIDPKSTIKYLGLLLDEHLTWKPFISKLKTKLTRAIGIISKLRHSTPLPFLKTVYHALFGSHLNYGCQLWGLSSETHTNSIQKLQNRALRKLTFTNLFNNISPVYKDLNIIKFNDHIHLLNCIFMFQFENNLLPQAFNSFSNLVSNGHNYNTRAVTTGLHAVPTFNTHRYGTLSLKNNCINDWNCFKRFFPQHIHENLSIRRIKTLFREHVYSLY